jgi:D-lactate dehydrogenase
MLAGKYLTLFNRLSGSIDPKRMFHDPLHTLAFGTDASFYRLIPKLVIKAKNDEEVSLILHETNSLELPVTFRAAGTSLSGQAISDSVLVIAGEHWKNYEILDEGLKIKLQPGLKGSRANAILAPYGRKIGPDPASIDTAMIGGIAANNASGMCCGTEENSYRTVAGMKIIFQDGTALDTVDPQSRQDFLESHPSVIEAITVLSKSVRKNKPLEERIRHKFRIKNTTGYSLNALVDFTDPFDIIEHLMIGSEGTLGFISEITYNTVTEHPFKATALIIFPDIENACKAVPILKTEPVSTVELIDRAGLRSVEDEPGIHVDLKPLSEGATALLVETRAVSKELLYKQINRIKDVVAHIPVELPISFTDIPSEYIRLWKIRKGLFPAVGAVRRAGTTVIIEDVAFAIDRLAEAVKDLQNLFKRHGYHEAVLFGHARDGNLHFVFTQDFGIEEEVRRYENFMNDVTSLVVHKYDGSLKAEHGTGRNMAPFVELEWGAEAYQLMKEIKAIFDPGNLLNPGVILNPDPRSHLKDLKPLPAANGNVDKCIECGFCEPSCVSAELTLTPRQRIAVYREISRLKRSGEAPHLAAALVNGYRYEGDETCATDGLCALTCPVKIDTGKLIKELRFQNITPRQGKRALWIADHMDTVTSLARISLSAASAFHSVLGSRLMGLIAAGMRKVSGNRIPQWNPWMPKGARKIRNLKKKRMEVSDDHLIPLFLDSFSPRKVVYFPSCINRSMGLSKYDRQEIQVTEQMQQLLRKGGFDIIYPERLNSLCCGMAFSSKGYKEAGMKKSIELEAALWKASNGGQYPILCDMSPCLFTMKENMKPGLKLYEPVEFILEHLIQHLEIAPVDETVTVFPVCSMKKMGMDQKLAALAAMCVKEVIVPEANCCGFAGDRGFTYPELNRHGLRELKAQLTPAVKQGYSTSRTCEIGLSLHSGIDFKSIVYLVDKVSKPKS